MEDPLKEFTDQLAAESKGVSAPGPDVPSDASSDTDDVATVDVEPATSPKDDRKRLIKAFWAAAALSVLLHVAQPYGRYLLYPFAFLSTWAHELGHGLTALLCGGEFLELRLFANLGGYAKHTATGFLARPIVAAGGLLGPAVAGAMLIIAGSRSTRLARAALALLGIAVLLSLGFWVRSLFGVVMTGLVGAGLVAMAVRAPQFLRLVVLQFLGIQFCLGSLSDFDYMFTKNFVRDGQTLNSDTQSIAESLMLPYWFWGGLIAALSIAILLFAFYVAWIRPMAKELEKKELGAASV